MGHFTHYDFSNENDGFDAADAQPWLMVPSGKSTKVKFEGDNDWAFSPSTSMKDMIEIRASRKRDSHTVMITGLKPGLSQVYALHPRERPKIMQVAVVRPRETSVALIFVEDVKGRRPWEWEMPSRDKLFVREVKRRLNLIFEPQANVTITKAVTGWRKYSVDLGDLVEWYTNQPFFLKNREKKEKAEFTIFVVWEVQKWGQAAFRTAADSAAVGKQENLALRKSTVKKVSRMKDQAGIANRKGKFAVVDPKSTKASLELVVAHELGHLLDMCHVKTMRRLMYESTRGAGSKIGRDEVLWAHGLKVCK